MLRRLCALRPNASGLWRQTTRASTSAVAESSAKNQSQPHTIVKHPVEDANTSNAYFAVIKLSGTQYKVTEGDVVITEKLQANVGSYLDLDEVLLVGSQQETIVGHPLIHGAVVRARVEEQTLDEKIDIFKKKRRKNYRRWNGFRRQVTVLRVTDIIPSVLNETEATK